MLCILAEIAQGTSWVICPLALVDDCGSFGGRVGDCVVYLVGYLVGE